MRIYQALKILEYEFEQNRLNNGSLLNLQDTLISILRNVRLPKEKIDTKFQMVVEEKNKKEIIPRKKNLKKNTNYFVITNFFVFLPYN